MNKYIKSIFFAVAALPLFAACDDGKIYDEISGPDSGSGITVVMKGAVTGCSDYADNTKYSPVLAAFTADNDFAVVSKPIADGDADVTISNVPSDAATIEVCLINRLRERIFTYSKIDVTDPGADIIFDAGSVDVSRFASVEQGIFAKTCTQCHGATGHAAASLNLMPGNAAKMLLGVPSTVVDGEVRVVPGNASASLLWETVATQVSVDWAFNHSNLLTEKESGFIEDWINSENPE